MTMTTIFLSIALMFTTINGLFTLFFHNEKFDSLPKKNKIYIRAKIIIPIALLIGITTSNIFAVIAFLLFLFGDIASMKDVKFSIPIFSLSHIFMIAAIIPSIVVVPSLFPILYTTIFMLVCMKNLFNIKSFGIKTAVFAYAGIIGIPILIISMASIASIPIIILGIGYYLFFFSDIVIAENAFVKPIKYAFTFNSILYYASLILFAVGILLL